MAGGSESQRIAVRGTLAHIHEIELEFVDLGDEQPVSRNDPKIALLAVLLDATEREQWPAAFRIPHANGAPPLIVALLPDRSSDLIQAALRAGADDVLSLPPAPEDALRVLLRASEMRRRAERPDDKKVCSLVSVSGGRGTSSLTVCLGFAMQRLFGKRTALVDLDLQAAPLSVLLDVEPEHSIADLADPTSPIDSIRLESVVTKPNSGPALLAAPRRIEQTELVSAATVEAALKVLYDMFDLVLVDCGSHLSESSVVVFENSDCLLYILDQSVTAVRAAQRFLDLYNSLELKERQPHLIVNRYRSDEAIMLGQIETALHLPVFATVPFDEAAFREIQTTGRDLWNISTGTNARRSIENLTRKLFTPKSQESPKPGLFSRLFGSTR
ncbi:MAG: AAA family ATPase [Deltaproteobacteria bacterium]|nr:AAA family ATPase [Deltaproteobacteria bacterium]